MERKLTRNKKCKNCGTPFDQKRFGQVVCGYTCSIPYGKKLNDKRVASDEKQDRKRVAKEIEELLPLSKLYPKLQVIINEIVRLIDKGQPCIATGNFGKMNAGHFFHCQSTPHLRFHLDNIHIQSFESNHHQSGDQQNYIEGIERVYGKAYKDNMIDVLRGKYHEQRYNKPMIQEAIITARKIRNDLKKLDQTYSADNRIKLRDKYNKIIAIYL